MRLGAIDVGTNSCRMLVVDYYDKNITEIKRDLKITRLGKGVDRTKRLTDKAVNRTLDAISTFVDEMRSLDVKKIKINGTSALRDVNNAQTLVDAVKAETGCRLNVISGDEEARLNYIGVGFKNSNNIIIDIGGGSTEFIWQEMGDIHYKSLNMGSVRMTERFIINPQNTVIEEELMAIEKDVQGLVNEQIGSILPTNIDKAIGLGGTITTIAAIDQGMDEYDTNRINNYTLKIEAVQRILTQLTNKNLGERKRIKGLQPGRADIIIAGIQILYVILFILNINDIVVSEHDLLYGAVIEMGEKR